MDHSHDPVRGHSLSGRGVPCPEATRRETLPKQVKDLRERVSPLVRLSKKPFISGQSERTTTRISFCWDLHKQVIVNRRRGDVTT